MFKNEKNRIQKSYTKEIIFKNLKIKKINRNSPKIHKMTNAKK